MKTRFLLPLWLAVCTLFVYGCAPELAEEYSPPAQETIDPEVIALIEEMGFKTDDIYVTDNAYWVESDIVIPKERLEELKKRPKTRQSYYGQYNLIAYDKVNNIRIKIDHGYADNFSYSPAMKKYHDELESVITEFNELNNCSINITESKNDDYDILIEPGYFEDGNPVHEDMMCAGEIPMNGMPGYRIYINADPECFGVSWASVSSSKVKSSLRHAIGHCLGLAHTGVTWVDRPGDWFSENTYDANLIEGTSNYDPDSVMSSAEHAYSDNRGCTLSDGDNNALSILYPSFSGGTIEINVGQTTASVMVGTVPPLFRNVREAAGGSAQITYKWQKSANGTTNWNDIPNTNFATYQQIDQLYDDTWYRRQAISGGEEANSNVVSITVTPDPGQIAGNQVIASGAIPAPLTSVRDAVGIGNLTPTYQWQMRESGSSWTDVSSNGISKTYQPGALTANTSYQRVAKSGGLTANSNIVSVTVIEFNPEISGPDKPPFNTEVTYETPTSLPPGVTFDEWEISPNTYVADDLSNPTLEVKFILPTEYTITANFILPGGETRSVEKVVKVPEFASITGPYVVFAYTNATYSIPSVLPAGVTFNGWSVYSHPDTFGRPSDYTITGGTSDPDLNISFTTGECYHTITANFILPNNISHSTKTSVLVRPALIYGPNKVKPHMFGIYYEAPYNIPNSTFTGWSITPEGQDQYHIENVNLTRTRIHFFGEGEYTLFANYSCDDGSTISLTETVSISSDISMLGFKVYMNSSTINWAGDIDDAHPMFSPYVLALNRLLDAYQASIKLFVLNPNPYELDCEWSLNGVIQEEWTGTEIEIDLLRDSYMSQAVSRQEVRISCRGRGYNYQDPAEGWGNSFTILIDSPNIFYID